MWASVPPMTEVGLLMTKTGRKSEVMEEAVKVGAHGKSWLHWLPVE